MSLPANSTLVCSEALAEVIMHSAFGWYSAILDSHTNDEALDIFSLAIHSVYDSCRRTDQTIPLPINSTLVCLQEPTEGMKRPTFG